MTCSFVVRLVAHEVDVPLTLRPGHGKVPVLHLDDGSTLTEVAAIVPYLAEHRPDAGLAPAADRHQLASWLSFVGAELHVRVLWPLFNPAPDAVRDHARASAPAILARAAAHLATRDHLVGDRFTGADAYLLWALLVARFAGLDTSSFTAYVKRHRARPSVTRLLAEELAAVGAPDRSTSPARSR